MKRCPAKDLLSCGSSGLMRPLLGVEEKHQTETSLISGCGWSSTEHSSAQQKLYGDHERSGFVR